MTRFASEQYQILALANHYMLSTNNIASYLENLEETLKGDVPVAVEQKIKEQNEKAKVCVYCLKVKYI